MGVSLTESVTLGQDAQVLVAVNCQNFVRNIIIHTSAS